MKPPIATGCSNPKATARILVTAAAALCLGLGVLPISGQSGAQFAFDFDHNGQPNHTVVYQPGTGSIEIVRDQQVVWESANGIGGYDLKSVNDKGFAFDCDHSGKQDCLVFYRPGTGAIAVIHHNPDGRFADVYDQVDNGNARGIGCFDLKSTSDVGYAIDYEGSGRYDYLKFERRGTNAYGIIKHTNGAFEGVNCVPDTGGGPPIQQPQPTARGAGAAYFQAVPVQAGPCVSQQAPPVDCKCGTDGHIVKANCTITVNPSTGQKCGGPYCESCYVVCNRK